MSGRKLANTITGRNGESDELDARVQIKLREWLAGFVMKEGKWR